MFDFPPIDKERAYDVIDAMAPVAKAHDTSVARVSLAWLRAQPGVTSTIIGARRVAQLEDNLKSLDVTLSPSELGHLDTLTKPSFGFPQSMPPVFPALT